MVLIILYGNYVLCGDAAHLGGRTVRDARAKRARKAHVGSLQLGMALCEGSARGSSPPHLWTGDSFICPNIKLAEAQSKRNSFEHFSIASPVGSKESSLIRSPLLSFSTPPLLSFSTPPLLSFSSLKWALHRMFSSVSTNINSQRFPRFNQPKG